MYYYLKEKKLILLLFLLLFQNVTILKSESQIHNKITYTVYAGGTYGIKDLSKNHNSKKFRQLGGGLYIHNSSWRPLSVDEKIKILTIFKKNPIAIELGFGIKKHAQAWAKLYRKNYIDLGINPKFIAVNGRILKNNIHIEHWKNFVNKLKRQNKLKKTKIYPTIEYQNDKHDTAKLIKNKFSNTKNFQDLALFSKGIVLDVPPVYFFQREQEYKNWVIDAIKWSNQNNIEVILIVSPHKSKMNYDEDTYSMLKYLKNYNALPSTLVSETYASKPSKKYPNRIGNENTHETILGTAYLMLKSWLPNM